MAVAGCSLIVTGRRSCVACNPLLAVSDIRRVVGDKKQAIDDDGRLTGRRGLTGKTNYQNCQKAIW